MEYYSSGYANYQKNGQSSSAGYYSDPNNYWENSIFYVGPYCKDASQIFLGTFMDDKCTYAATHATFSSTYKTKSGESFPYFQSPIVAVGQCISCQDEQDVYDQIMAQTQNSNNNRANSNQYMQRSSYYSYNNNDLEEEGEEEQEPTNVNDLCNYLKEGEDGTVISCVYSSQADGDNNANYAGCSYLDMLPTLDGRNRMETSTHNLGLQQNYTVVLAVLACILMMSLAAMTLCDPSAIEDRKRNLLAEAEIERSPTSLGVEAVID